VAKGGALCNYAYTILFRREVQSLTDHHGSPGPGILQWQHAANPGYPG